MKYVSEEVLREMLERNSFIRETEFERGFKHCLALLLELECKELNQWLPIEKAPKDEFLLMFIPGHGKEVMLHREIKMWSPKPTHYQELPEAPKE